MLTELALVVESWGAIAAIRTSPVLYPLVSALHILGLGVLVGTIVPLDLRIIGISKPDRWREAILRTSPVAASGLSLALVTGILLFAVRASHYLENTALLLKFGLIAVSLVNVVGFHCALKASCEEWPAPRLRILAFVSACTWIGALFAGRWIAFAV